jgi:solute carrier family 31 (copper transporter), member 1
MTYNGFIMIAVGIGASVGYLLFAGNSSASKSSACH